MRIKKIKLGNKYIYPATITTAIKDINFTKSDNIPMT
jgi:beta-galactosidase